MRALQVVSHDGPGDLRACDVPEPVDPPEWTGTTSEGFVTLQVRAAAVSVPDLLQTRGRYQVSPALPFVLGSEIAGTIISAPSGSGFRTGDRVAAYTPSGGMAEIAVAPAVVTVPVPSDWSFAQASCFVVSYHTAYFALITRGMLSPGGKVVIHGAAGSLAQAAIHVARGVGAHVIAVVSTLAKEAICRAAGADEVVTTDGWKDEVLDRHPDGVDVVLDPVGGELALDNMRVLSELGRWVVVGFASGGIPEIRTNRLLLKNVSAVGASWGGFAFTRPRYVETTQKVLSELIYATGLKPVVGCARPVESAAEAFAYAEDREAVGRAVIEF